MEKIFYDLDKEGCFDFTDFENAETHQGKVYFTIKIRGKLYNLKLRIDCLSVDIELLEYKSDKGMECGKHIGGLTFNKKYFSVLLLHRGFFENIDKLESACKLLESFGIAKNINYIDFPL